MAKHRVPRRYRLTALAATATVLAVVAALLGVTSPAFAATFTLNSLTATVSGTTVAVNASVTASSAVTAQYYGVCVRSASGANLDYPKRSNVAFAAGVAQTTSGSKTFTAGTYTYFACVDVNNTWTTVGGSKTFTVGGTVTPTTANVTATPADGTVTVNWSLAVGGDGANGAVLSRDGTDTSGAGPWTAPNALGTSGSRLFDKLTDGTTYHFTVQPTSNGVNTGTATTVAATPTATTPPPPPPPGGSPLVGPRSRLPWVEGAYLDHNAANIGPFESGSGRSLDAAEVFPTRDSQSALLDPWWLSSVTPITSNGGWAVVTVPLWTADQSVGTDTTSLFTQLGQQINANLPAGRTLVRLGWEMNLPDWYWNVTSGNRAQWVADFQRAAGLLRQYAPGVKIAFNPNEGASQTSLTDIGALAGDLSGSFDYVGPDFYNWYPQMDSQSTWNSRYAESYGLGFWENWAKGHGKGYTVPEWGVTTAVNNSTGTLYVQQMIARFAAMANGGTPVIEAYFNEPASYLASSLWNPTQAPQAAQAYHDALAAQPAL